MKAIKILLAGVVALSASTAHGKAMVTCAVVATSMGDLENSSEFLHIRLKPNTNSRIMGKVKAGDIIYIDTDPTMDLFRDWVYTYSGVDHHSARGWVARKFIKEIACPPEYLEPEGPDLPPPQINTIPVPR